MKDIGEIDLAKIDRLLDKIEKDKKKQQPYNANTDSNRYVTDINKTLEIYSLALEEISQSLELLGLSPYSEVLTKLFKGLHDHSLSILKFGLNNLKRFNTLKETHQQAQQQQSPIITGPPLIDPPDNLASENNQLNRDLSPSCVTLDERMLQGGSPSPSSSMRIWNGELRFLGKPHFNLLVPVPLNQQLNAPQAMNTFRSLTVSPTSKADAATAHEESGNLNASASASPVNLLRKSAGRDRTPEDDEELKKYIQEHEKMQKDINEVLKGKTVVEKLEPRKISIHLKQALKGLEFTNKKVNSIADNTLGDDDENDNLEQPNFEEMGDRIKEAFNQAKFKAAKNLEGMLKTAKDGFRKGNPVKNKPRAKTVRLNQGGLRDVCTMTDDVVSEQDIKHEKELNELKTKIAAMDQEKTVNDNINNKIATAYSMCVRENRDLKVKITMLEDEVKAIKHAASKEQEASIHIPENNHKESAPNSAVQSQQEIEQPAKNDEARLKQMHQDIIISLAAQNRKPLESHNIRDYEQSVKHEGSSPNMPDTAVPKNGDVPQTNLEGPSVPSTKADNVIESLEKKEAGTLQNLDKDLHGNKEESRKKNRSLGRATSMGKIDGKIILKSSNETSPQAKNEKNSSGAAKPMAGRQSDSSPKSSSSDTRAMKKQKTLSHMSQTVTDRSPKNMMKSKAEFFSPGKPTKVIQPVSVNSEKNMTERDIKQDKNVLDNKPSQYKTPERRGKEAAGTLNLSSGIIKSHNRVGSMIDGRSAPLEGYEESGSGERGSPRAKQNITSINFEKLGPLNFKKYHKSQPATSRDVTNGGLKSKDELLKELKDINTLNGLSSLHERRGSKSTLGPLFGVNKGGMSERTRPKRFAEESKDEDEEFSNSIHSARYTDHSHSYRRNHISTDLWGMSPKFSKFKDDTEVQFYTPKVSTKFDPDIFGKIKIQRRGDFAGNLTSRRPFCVRPGAEHFNLYKNEILQIEKIRKPDGVLENEDEQGNAESTATGRLPFSDRRKKAAVGLYTETANLVHWNISNSPVHNREHENFTEAKTMMRYNTVVKPNVGKLTIDECIMIETVKESEIPTSTREEAQIRVMYRGVLSKVKQQPKFANYIRGLVYRDIHATFNDDHPVVEYDLFEQFVRNFIESHAKCGDNCQHVKNFYAKIGYQTFWNNRAPLVVKKTEIGHHNQEFVNQSPRLLPNIAKKKRELVPEAK